MAKKRIAITSDLYFPVTPKEKIIGVIKSIKEFQPEVVVLAGDMADSLVDFGRLLAMFRAELPCPIYVIPGDVDFWARPPYDSHKLWMEYLPKATIDQGCIWLEGAAVNLGDVALAGTVAWYDYSSATPSGLIPDMEFAQKKFEHNADALRIDWEWSDPEFASFVSIRLLTNLEHLEQDSTIREVVVVTHFPVLAPQLTGKAGGPFATAYSGNLTLGRKLLGFPKVRHIISGHNHAAKKGVVARDDMDPLSFFVVGSNYDKPDWLGLQI